MKDIWVIWCKTRYSVHAMICLIQNSTLFYFPFSLQVFNSSYYTEQLSKQDGFQPKFNCNLFPSLCGTLSENLVLIPHIPIGTEEPKAKK